MSFPECAIVDRTDDRCNFLNMLKDFSQVSWKDLLGMIDKCMSIPDVRCRLGCSEFVHKGNLIPFQAVLQYYLRKSIMGVGV